MAIDNDPEKIYQAATAYLGTPLLQMKQAHQIVKQQCTLPAVAFGILPSTVLSGPYETARSYEESNLDQGVAKIDETGVGLATVAQRYGKADAVNAIGFHARPQAPPLDAAAVRGGNTGWQLTGLVSGGVAAGGSSAWLASYLSTLTAWNVSVGAVLKASATAERTAAAAVVMWLLFSPDATSINRAGDGWTQAANALSACSGSITEVNVRMVAPAWVKGADKAAYDQYFNVLKTEIDQSKESATQNKDALLKILNELNDAQNTFFYAAMASLVTILLLKAAELTPYVGPLFTILKAIQGLILTGMTVTTLASVLAIIHQGVTPMAGWAGSGDLIFSRPKGNAALDSGPAGDSFRDIKIDQWGKP